MRGTIVRSSTVPFVTGTVKRYGNRRRFRASKTTRTVVVFGVVFAMMALLCLAGSVSDNVPMLRRRLVPGSANKDCNTNPNLLEEVDTNFAGVIYTIVLCILFVGLAAVTDDFFVPALEVMTEKLELSDDVAGATLMASGSSAPELGTNLVDTLFYRNSIGVSTIVGSAVFNILVIIACSGAFAKEDLAIDWRPFARDCFFYSCSIILLLSFTVLDGSNGEVWWYEALVLFLFHGVYVLFMMYNQQFMARLDKKNKKAATTEEKNQMDKAFQYADKQDQVELGQLLVTATLNLSSNLTHDEEKALMQELGTMDITLKPQSGSYKLSSNQAFSEARRAEVTQKVMAVKQNAPSEFSAECVVDSNGSVRADSPEDDSDEDEGTGCILIDVPVGAISFVWGILFKFSIPQCKDEDLEEELEKTKDSNRQQELQTEIDALAKKYGIAFAASVIYILLLSYGMVYFADRIGCLLGVNPVLMGLTVLAAGTSVPDALGSIEVAKKGKGDMAVANAIGSNVFDILIGCGLPWFLSGCIYKETYDIDTGDVPLFICILFGTVLMTILSFIFTNWKLGKTLGWMLLMLYLCFVVFAIFKVRRETD